MRRRSYRLGCSPRALRRPPGRTEFTIVVDLDAPVVEIENGTKLTFEFRRDDHVLVYATEKGENDPGVIPPSPDNGDRQKVTVWVDTAAITAGCGPIPVGSSHTG